MVTKHELTISLPFPPSGNRYWRHVPNLHRPILSREALAYRAAVAQVIPRQIGGTRLKGPLRVTARFHPPDQRARDLDNHWKQVGDALQHAGLYDDDSQIRDLRLMWGAAQRPGFLAVAITPMPQQKQQNLLEV